MKTVIIPLTELNPGCDVFQPCHAFDSEWCLDLHGFLSRDEFATRLKEINNYIRAYPLLSERAKTFIKYACIAVAVLIAIITIVSIYAASTRAPSYSDYSSYSSKPKSSSNSFAIAGPIIEGCLGIGYFVARYLIQEMARRRAEKFNNAVNNLFAQYNQQENPTANWNLVWRTAVTHYTIKMKASLNGSVKGEATPVYAEYAEIVLEINDALSDLTSRTLRVNLSSEVVSTPYGLAQSHIPQGYPPQQTPAVTSV
ncbi:1939_t:CDS:1 [Ambispora gerdemannii]|uniref:1939_t:CDS:1 n=1 Tax=Ambispora gerdemannii TaxID=144530 RepID=A0A9N9GSJ3_9GLOM|nr:1939_t:CDS:1 [Ambispora gerdemannii]